MQKCNSSYSLYNHPIVIMGEGPHIRLNDFQGISASSPLFISRFYMLQVCKTETPRQLTETSGDSRVALHITSAPRLTDFQYCHPASDGRWAHPCNVLLQVNHPWKENTKLMHTHTHTKPTARYGNLPYICRIVQAHTLWWQNAHHLNFRPSKDRRLNG
jgi:hypothetical protein